MSTTQRGMRRSQEEVKELEKNVAIRDEAIRGLKTDLKEQEDELKEWNMKESREEAQLSEKMF